MSTSEAERYGRRAQGSTTAAEVGDSVRRAVDALVEAIKALEERVKKLESKAR